jgi:hypothetical protein
VSRRVVKARRKNLVGAKARTGSRYVLNQSREIGMSLLL